MDRTPGWLRLQAKLWPALEERRPSDDMEARMGLMDALRNLFRSGGGTSEAAGPAVEYHGYRIMPAPQRQASGWNTAGVITKEFPDGMKKHRFVRVDTHASKDDAVSFSITKAQQIIDEQGDRIFRNA
jgi:hypothetical protein